jgi:endonuclease-3
VDVVIIGPDKPNVGKKSALPLILANFNEGTRGLSRDFLGLKIVIKSIKIYNIIMPNSELNKILIELDRLYPEPTTALHAKNPLELLVATVLSAQCTDARVNRVTPGLFKKYKSAQDYAQADPEALQAMIRSTGFYKAKAANLMKCGAALLEKHEGRIPKSLEEMVELPGVGRKTANVVLGTCFGIPGIVVDTHVKRLSFRLGLTRHTDPTKIEFDLMKQIPKKKWILFSHQLILHGRKICKAQKPLCPACGLEKWCRKVGVGIRDR